MFKDSFTECRGILKSIGKLISHDDTCIPRITIRSLKHLAQDNLEFQNLIIKNGLLSQIIKKLKPIDKSFDTQYWSVVFFHTLLLNEGSHAEFLDSEGLQGIINIGLCECPKNLKVFLRINH